MGAEAKVVAAAGEEANKAEAAAAGEEAATGARARSDCFSSFLSLPLLLFFCLVPALQAARSLAALSEPRTHENDRWARHG